jgi:hypothetical protein
MPSRLRIQRRMIIFGIGLLLITAAIVTLIFRAVPDPVIEGHKLSELLTAAYGLEYRNKRFTNNVEAARWLQHQHSLKQIVNKGLPSDSMLLIDDWIDAYDGRTVPKLEALVRRLGFKIKPQPRQRPAIAANAIADCPELVAQSEHLIPILTANLTNHDAEVRAGAIKALREVLLRFPPRNPAQVATNVQASFSDGRRLWRFELSHYDELVILSSDRRDAHIRRLRRERAEVERLMLGETQRRILETHRASAIPRQ